MDRLVSRVKYTILKGVSKMDTPFLFEIST